MVLTDHPIEWDFALPGAGWKGFLGRAALLCIKRKRWATLCMRCDDIVARMISNYQARVPSSKLRPGPSEGSPGPPLPCSGACSAAFVGLPESCHNPQHIVWASIGPLRIFLRRSKISFWLQMNERKVWATGSKLLCVWVCACVCMCVCPRESLLVRFYLFAGT